MTTRHKRDPEAERQAGLAALEDQLGWKFIDRELLQLALTHRSYTYEARHGHDPLGAGRNEPGEDNEQLEFLGDAVLGAVVTESLFREFTDRTEGELTRMRASLVSRERMAKMGEILGLGPLLLLGKSAMLGGARRKLALLANAAEAILAAVYLDAGERGTEVIRKIIREYLTEPDFPMMRKLLAHENGRGVLRDSKTLLQERVQARSAGRIVYIDTGHTGPAHDRCFAVEARLENESGFVTLSSAEGGSKKEAQQKAAAIALENWARLVPARDSSNSGEAA